MTAPALPSDALSADAIWREMRLHMEWNEALSLCFLFTPDLKAVAQIQQWTHDAWAFRSAPLRVITPSAPAQAAQQVLQGLQQQVQQQSMARAPVWVQLTALDDSQQSGWDSARSEVLARLNEAREWLVQSFARPLVLCLPPAWRSQVAVLAPDLWHIRSYSALVLPSTGPVLRSELAGPETRTLDAFAQRRLEPARGQLRQARERLAQNPTTPNLQRELSVALDGLGTAYEESSHGQETLAAYRESLEIRRQLRQALGETPQVLRDLSISLDNVGRAENDAGHGQEALAAYRESLEISRQLRQALGETPQVLDDLAVSLERLAAAQATDVGGRKAAIAEAIALRERLVAATHGAHYYVQRLERAQTLADTVNNRA